MEKVEVGDDGEGGDKLLLVEESLLDPETELLYWNKEEDEEDRAMIKGNEWEIYKENVKPLKKGRNTKLLNHALLRNNSSALHALRRRFIEAIHQYKGQDPLHPWLQCIKWVQEAFPPGGDCSGLVVIYEQCVRTFWHQDRYKNDLRYLKVWLEYAENCLDSQVVYSFLEANNIGQTHSPFYISYALHLESKHKIGTAREIFERGISRDAQPMGKLKVAYKKFLARSMGRQKAIDEDPIENCLPSRSFGTVLTKGANFSTESSDFSRKKLKQNRAQGNPFTIYKDTSSEASSLHQPESVKTELKPWHVLGARAERNKENSAIPTKWTSNKIPCRAGPRTGVATPVPCIEVFVDEECGDNVVDFIKNNYIHRECNRSWADLKWLERTLSHPQNEKAVGEIGRSSSLQLGHGNGQGLKRETELLREKPLRNFPSNSLPR